MRRNWILGLAVLAGVAGAATMAATVFGGGSEPRLPDHATVTLRPDTGAGAAGLQARPRKGKKPTVIYLTVQPATVNTAPPPAGIGPNIDIGLGPCPGNSRVLEGGVVPADLDTNVQGSYIENKRRYHVLLEDEGSPSSFQVDGHLTCIKGVKAQG